MSTDSDHFRQQARDVRLNVFMQMHHKFHPHGIKGLIADVLTISEAIITGVDPHATAEKRIEEAVRDRMAKVVEAVKSAAGG